jgi:hypothetical protein
MNALRRHRAMARIWASDPGWRGWFTTVNHTDIGRMFLLVAVVYFFIGGILAMLIRAQLATPRSPFMGPEIYNQIFTMHGTIMMFLFAIPLFEGLAVYLLPKLLGARDLAFPRLTAYGFWCYVFGGSMLLFALVAGIAPDSGWFMYPPLSSTLGSPGINSDFWLIGITFVEISAICAAVEITVSILRYRAPGMTLFRMPIFAWYALVTSLMILTGFPPLILGSLLLELERAFGLPFFQVEHGGDSLLWQHLFWLFGHPEVYIIFLPAAGAISTILPVMARTTLLGYAWVVVAAISLGVLSFGIWVHHMFATGIPHMALAFFSAASTLVAMPTGVQIFAWLGTLVERAPADAAADAVDRRVLRHVRDRRADRGDGRGRAVRLAGPRHRLRDRASALCAGRGLRLSDAGCALLLDAAPDRAQAVLQAGRDGVLAGLRGLSRHLPADALGRPAGAAAPDRHLRGRVGVGGHQPDLLGLQFRHGDRLCADPDRRDRERGDQFPRAAQSLACRHIGLGHADPAAALQLRQPARGDIARPLTDDPDLALRLARGRAFWPRRATGSARR